MSAISAIDESGAISAIDETHAIYATRVYESSIAEIAASPELRKVVCMPDVTADRAGYVAALPTFAQSAAMIGIHPSGIGRAVQRLGIEPLRWGNRDKHLSVADLMRLAEDAHRETVQTVASRLLEQVARDHPAHLAPIRADLDAFTAELAPPRAKTVLRSPLEPDTARRLVALYTLPSAPEEP